MGRRPMVALLVCQNRDCRAAFEAEGDREAIEALRCEDCNAPLHAAGYADAPDSGVPPSREVSVRRAA